MSLTFTLRSTLEIAERLARRLVCNVEAYWSVGTFTDDVISIAPQTSWTIPIDTFRTVLVDCDAEWTLFLGWTQDTTTVEVPINQLAIVSGTLASAYIRNGAADGTPNATCRILTLSP